MERYKLIKTYPNSPKLGTIVLKGASHDPHPDLYGNESNNVFFKTDEIEKYPEYWEKVEVIFTTEDGVGIEEGQAVYCVFTDENLSQYMYPKPFQYNNLTPEFKNEHKIFSTEKVAKDYCEARKPKPLLITEEGVEVFKGCTIYYVKPDYSFGWEGVVDAKSFKKEETGWYFSTKEKAKIFIDKHKVIEKEYEILALVCIKNIGSLYKGDTVNKKGDKFEGVSKDGVSILFNTNNYSTDIWDIYSVKRLSDNQILSIDDYVKVCAAGDKPIKITGFRKIKYMEDNKYIDGIFAFEEEGKTYLIDFNCQKVEPILKTEDGVDIFDGDRVWYYDSMYRIWDSKADTKIHNKRNTAFTYFSTKEAAEKFVKVKKGLPSTITNNQAAKNLVVDLIDKSKSLENVEKDYFKHVIKNKL